MTIDPEIRQLERRVFDEATQGFINEPAELREIAGWRGIGTSVVVRDARGMLIASQVRLSPSIREPCWSRSR